MTRHMLLQYGAELNDVGKHAERATAGACILADGAICAGSDQAECGWTMIR